MNNPVCVFGQIESGKSCRLGGRPIVIDSREALFEKVGSPDSESLTFSVQTLLLGIPLLFFQVEQEGVSIVDYVDGVQFLWREGKERSIAMVFLPGVSDREILERFFPACRYIQAMLCISSHDLYDHFTNK